MTQEDAIKLLPIIKAYSEGKTIEVRSLLDGSWGNISNPQFDGDPSVYRIKPEPKLIPFTYEDAKELLGRAVRSKKGIAFAIIEGIYQNSYQIDVVVGGYTKSYKELLSEFEFIDTGEPCGKLVE